MSYYCFNCRRKFDELDTEITTYERLYGVLNDFSSRTKTEISVCPYCKCSDYKEIKKEEKEDEES